MDEKGIKNPFEWEFLKEPLYRWLMFIVAITFLLKAWNGVVREVIS